MPAVIELEDTPVSTGTAFSTWLRDQFAESQSQTGKLFPVRVLCVGPLGATFVGERLTGTANTLRTEVSSGKDWAKNLFLLTSAAKLIIPEMREMTAAENRNLRGYYNHLYRKA